MPTIYLYSHIYSIKDVRPVSADASSSSLLATRIVEIHTCHPLRFNSRSVARSGCYIIIVIIYTLCNRTLKQSPHFLFIPFVRVHDNILPTKVDLHCYTCTIMHHVWDF